MKNEVNKFLNYIYQKNLNKRFFMFVMGMLIGAFSFNLFYEPYNVIPSGSSGLAFLLTQFIDLNISVMVFIISFILFLISLIFFDKKYALKMLISTILYPIFLSATLLVTKYIDLEKTSVFLVMIFGGASMGFSSGLIRNSRFSPGGFSVIFDLIYKYFHISIGTSSSIINSILIMASAYVFGISNALYAIIALLTSSYIVDKVIIGVSNNKVFYIITEKPLEIRDYIIDKLHYSVTIINARGGYTNKKKKMLMCVVPTIEYVKLKELVGELDPKVFFLIVDTYESSIKKNCKYM